MFHHDSVHRVFMSPFPCLLRIYKMVKRSTFVLNARSILRSVGLTFREANFPLQFAVNFQVICNFHPISLFSFGAKTKIKLCYKSRWFVHVRPSASRAFTPLFHRTFLNVHRWICFCPPVTDPALRPCCGKRISLPGSMRRRVKYDNAQRGSKVGAKLPARAAETHQSRPRREHAEQTTAWLFARRGKRASGGVQHFLLAGGWTAKPTREIQLCAFSASFGCIFDHVIPGAVGDVLLKPNVLHLVDGSRVDQCYLWFISAGI